MSSIVTQMIVAERYGVRLNTEQLAEVMGLTKGALYNQISAGTFPVLTYLDAGKRWADYRDVADYLDKCREQARAA
jgi:predicted DNA-binding transcriptional regulator AlpA